MATQTPPAVPAENTTALLLTGGGARAAYQVGVLHAIADMRRAAGAIDQPNPFPIITGTSAGAINAAALACGADDFDSTVRNIVDIWENFHADQVYRSDFFGVARTGASWVTLLTVGWITAKWRRIKPRSLLDNSPVKTLLAQIVPLGRLRVLIRRGHLKALAVTASSYSTGEHMTFFEGAPGLATWERSQRRSVRDRITHAHLLASSAIPFIFPAVPLEVEGNTEYFGDGSMRQSAPIAAAIHLGAERILVIGAGRMTESHQVVEPPPTHRPPSLAQIAGHALSNIFLDALAVDIERARRINQTLTFIPPEARDSSALRPLNMLVIAPSQQLDGLAARHIGALPPAVRTLLAAIGVSSKAADAKGAALASYLLFERDYTRALMALGYQDAYAQESEVLAFFGWTEITDPLRSDTPQAWD